jgi:hypothetical protein
MDKTNSANSAIPHKSVEPAVKEASSSPAVKLGDRYVWPRGLNGLPLRTVNDSVPLIKSEELDYVLREAAEGHVDIFDLNDPEQFDKYRNLIRLCAIGWAETSFIERRWVESTGSWKVYIEYVLYYHEPKNDIYSSVQAGDGMLRIG